MSELIHESCLMAKACAGIAFLALLAVPKLSAQMVRGTTVDAVGGPLAGAVVSLIDEKERTHASVLSSARGEYVLKADNAGRFVLRARALGYTPTVSDAFDLAREQIETRRIVFATRVSLAAVRVDGHPHVGNVRFCRLRFVLVSAGAENVNQLGADGHKHAGDH